LPDNGGLIEIFMDAAVEAMLLKIKAGMQPILIECLLSVFDSVFVCNYSKFTSKRFGFFK
jgi:hypothetical protein